MNSTKKLILFISLMAQALAPSLSLAATYRYDRFVPTLKVTEPANPGGGAQTGGGSGGSTGEGTNGGTGGSTGGGLPPGTDPVAVLGVSSRDLTFGFVQNGSSKTKQLLVTNTGGAALTFAQEPMVSGEGFSASTTCGVTLAASSNCLINVVFSPTVEMRYSGALTLTPSVGEPLTVTLSGYGQNSNTNFSISSTTYNFGEVIVGKASPRQYFSVYNDGTEPVSAFEVTVEGPFEVTSSCTPATNLQPLTSCSFGVAAKPSLAQVQAGTVTVTAGGISRQLSLAVTGIDSVQELSPGLVNFGSTLPPNVAAVQAVNLSNQGAAVTYTAPVLTGTGYNLASGGTCSNTGGTLAADDTCSFLVQLNSTAGVRNGTFTVTVGSKELSTSLQGTVASSEVGFSGSRSGFTTPPTSVTVTNPVGVEGTSVSTTFPTVFVYSPSSVARTYDVWVEGDAGIYVGLVSSSSTSSSSSSRAINSAAPFQVATTAAYPTLTLGVKADTTSPGTHTKRAVLRVKATDGSYDASLPLTAVFKWNVSVGELKTNAVNKLSPYTQNSILDFGGTVVSLNSAETTGLIARGFLVQANGSNGRMRGYWTLSGSTDFTLSGIYQYSLTNGAQACGTTISSDKQNSGVCAGAELSSSSTYTHIYANVYFRPSSVGDKTTILTFTPSDSTQGAPVSFLLKARGENNVAVGQPQVTAGTSRSDYILGSTVDFGKTLTALNSAETSGLLVRGLSVQASGTHGRLRGYWTLSGSTDFTLSGVYQQSLTSGTQSCGVPISADKQTSGVCAGAELSESSTYKHIFAGVYFQPTSVGVKTTVLTFTPVDSTQGSPVTFLLRASGENDVRVGALSSGTSASPTSAFASLYNSLNGVSYGNAALNQTVSRAFGIKALGAYGKFSGQWSLSGSSDFTIVYAQKGYSSAAAGCGATVAADKRSTSTCTADELSGTSQYTGILAQVQFKPTSSGSHSAILTFTPDANQGSPVSFSLSATAQ